MGIWAHDKGIERDVCVSLRTPDWSVGLVNCSTAIEVDTTLKEMLYYPPDVRDSIDRVNAR